MDLYRAVYNTMESDPGKVNCQAKHKKSHFAMQTVLQVLRITLSFVYCTVIRGLFLQIFSTFCASLDGAVFIYLKSVFSNNSLLGFRPSPIKRRFSAGAGELVSWNYTEPESWIHF